MAFEAASPDWLDERTLAHDAELLVVDKPFGIPVHGGPDGAGADLVTALKRWLRNAGRDDYLGVHQRLDQETSGVLLFTLSRGVNAAVAQDIEARAMHRTYIACVADPGLAPSGTLKHRLAAGPGGRVRVSRRSGKPAVTRFRVLERVAGRALLELRPETGRTHQLRVQLAAVGAPIAGDRLYGGSPAARLMLHAIELELPGLERRFVAPPPAALTQWARTGTTCLPVGSALVDTLRDAIWKRRQLIHATTAYRLANGWGDCLPGATVDRYDEFAVLAVSSEEAHEKRLELARALVELGARGVYLKSRVRSDLRRLPAERLAPADPIAGEAAPDPLAVREGRLTLQVSLGAGLATGLFVDQRDNRERLRRAVRGARVLNLFCYTCAFSVAAALGEAAEVVSVDLSERALRRGRENFVLSGLDPRAYRFIKDDAMDWLRRARRREARYDFIVLDPPTFATSKKRASFRVADDYGRVASDALGLLAPRGRLLAVTNHKGTSLGRLRRILRTAARTAHRQVTQLKDLPGQMDCPPGPEGPVPGKSVLVTVE